MSISATIADERIADVETTEDELKVRLVDGRTISAPLFGILAFFTRPKINARIGRSRAAALESIGKT